RVQPELAQVAGRFMLAMFGTIRAGAPAMVHSAPIAGDVSSAMRDADLQPRMVIQHAAEDQMTQRESGFQRISDQIVKVIFAHPLCMGEAERVNENEYSQFLCRRPERTK